MLITGIAGKSTHLCDEPSGSTLVAGGAWSGANKVVRLFEVIGGAAQTQAIEVKGEAWTLERQVQGERDVGESLHCV